MTKLDHVGGHVNFAQLRSLLIGTSFGWTSRASRTGKNYTMLKRIGLIAVLTFVSLVLGQSSSASRSAWAQENDNCQDQICGYDGDCFGCTASEGFGCGVDPDDCDKCASSECPPLIDPLPAPSVTSYNGAAASIRVAAACATAIRPTGWSSLSLPPPGRTGITVLSQPDSPAGLVSGTFSRSSLFESGILKNWSSKPVTAYQLARLDIDREKKTSIHEGPRINAYPPLKAGMTRVVPSQNMAGEILESGRVSLIVFFVQYVEFGDGSRWHENVDGLKDRILADFAADARKAMP